MLQCDAHVLQNALTQRTVEAGNERMFTPLSAGQVRLFCLDNNCPSVAIMFFCLWIKPCSVTIYWKATEQYFHVVLFVL